MKNLQIRRLFSLLGGLMLGAGSGVSLEVVVNPSSPSASPAFGLVLAGLGVGVMVSAALTE